MKPVLLIEIYKSQSSLVTDFNDVIVDESEMVASVVLRNCGIDASTVNAQFGEVIIQDSVLVF